MYPELKSKRDIRYVLNRYRGLPEKTLARLYEVYPIKDAKPITRIDLVNEPVIGARKTFAEQFVDIYSLNDCEPLTREKNTPVPDNIIAFQQNRAIRNAKSLMFKKSNTLFLDVETTSPHLKSQIIELAITDGNGVVKFNSLIKPSIKLCPKAAKVHGLTEEDLENAPTWPEVYKKVRKILYEKHVVMFSSDFDIRSLRQTCYAFKLKAGWVCSIKPHCAKKIACDFLKHDEGLSLVKATTEMGLSWKGVPHRALSDTLATVDLIYSISKFLYTGL